MTDDPELIRRRGLTFAQAEGVDLLPSQLKPREISPELRSRVWALILQSITSVYKDTVRRSRGRNIFDPWDTILFDLHTYVEMRPADEFDPDYEISMLELKQTIWNTNYIGVFGFLQEVIRHPKCPRDFVSSLERELRAARAPYRIVEKTIIPFTSEQEAAAVATAIETTKKANFAGAYEHLKQAAEACTSGNYADSVRESIHAVESVARMLDKDAKELSSALAALEAKSGVHGALKQGFLKLYGYASDEKGIRHPMLESGAPQVDEVDAMFMLSACAAFVTYLMGKARASGLIS
ncbi:AbiJ-NTD4 domain-containing protein [Mesorhizobium sp.]|uniref:AbiJ-NTD4 domain-containing protein n=1 Tax=Mesorhizobium sp. TaxID=1871066 RepID=UPI000FEA5E55|nr:hypothetical protein [Mesorhizobium sp.]RWO87968.1 MAG: hypothetical protein EOQ96_10510 [Mesorhizobium sp.]